MASQQIPYGMPQQAPYGNLQQAQGGSTAGGGSATIPMQQSPPSYGISQGITPPLEQHIPQAPPYNQDLGVAPELPNGEKPTFQQSFRIDKPKYHDIWAGVLFIITFLGFTAVSALAIQGYSAHQKKYGGGIYNGANGFSLDSNTAILFAFVLTVAFSFSWAYFILARAFTKQFIWITGILQIVLGLGQCIYFFTQRYYSAAIFLLILSVFYIICFISWIPRIPFSVLMLQTVMDVARHHGRIFTVSLVGGLIATAFGAWFSVTLVAIYIRFQPSPRNQALSLNSKSSRSNATLIGLIIFVTFAGYWITEFIRQAIHTTIAGVYGSWYFCSRRSGGMPSGTTRGAFRRTMTYSFGSVSFGSLIVSVVQLLRQAVAIAQRTEQGSGNIVITMLLCFVGCVAGLLEWVIEFFNHYAFSHIALYGKAYIPAAKDTWSMMKNRGIDVLVNSCLIDPVLTMGATLVGYICTLLSYLYLIYTKPVYNESGSYTPVILAFSFIIGLQIANIFLTPLKSGVATFFVAAAWDPEVLMRDHADLYTRMVAIYPQVAEKIHA